MTTPLQARNWWTRCRVPRQRQLAAGDRGREAGRRERLWTAADEQADFVRRASGAEPVHGPDARVIETGGWRARQRRHEPDVAGEHIAQARYRYDFELIRRRQVGGLPGERDGRPRRRRRQRARGKGWQTGAVHERAVVNDRRLTVKVLEMAVQRRCPERVERLVEIELAHCRRACRGSLGGRSRVPAFVPLFAGRSRPRCRLEKEAPAVPHAIGVVKERTCEGEDRRLRAKNRACSHAHQTGDRVFAIAAVSPPPRMGASIRGRRASQAPVERVPGNAGPRAWEFRPRAHDTSTRRQHFFLTSRRPAS